jgi:alpha/beta superfamily hydrolase
MNFFTNLFGGSYEDLWKAVIRPTRDSYDIKELGPEKFEIKNKFYKRTDFELKNKRNYKLQCSFWEPYDEEREYERLPCVVYLHGNSSSRCEAVNEIKYLLPMNITFFAFDFSGCGKSEGEYISLGWYERDDVECVIEYLRKTNKVSTIGLWGRSMGAVTAIMYGDRDPSIAGLVLDSAFSSLKVLIEELVKDRINLPGFILNKATNMVKNTINKKAKFNLDEIEPIKYAKRCFIPALFCHANGDNFVKIHHCKELYDIYPGDKNKIYVDGDHNSIRPKFFRDSASIFFYNTLQVNFIKEISDNYKGFKFMIKNNEIEESKNNKNIENNENNENNNKDQYNFENNEQFPSFNDEMDEELMFQKILELSKKEYEQQKNNSKNNENNVLIFEKKDKKIEQIPNDINNLNISDIDIPNEKK